MLADKPHRTIYYNACVVPLFSSIQVLFLYTVYFHFYTFGKGEREREKKKGIDGGLLSIDWQPRYIGEEMNDSFTVQTGHLSSGA